MLRRALAAEGLGSLLLAATVLGSGIMAERLAGGNLAIALIANTGATVAVLATLTALLSPMSGAHFNPAVSLAQALRGVLPWRHACSCALTQVAGCCAGAILAHAMFDLPLIQVSLHGRTGVAQWLAEVVATSGLVLVVLGHRRAEDAPWMVAAWIGAAYWFTLIDLVRESRHYHRAIPVEHLCRDRALAHAGIHSRAAAGRVNGCSYRTRSVRTGRCGGIKILPNIMTAAAGSLGVHPRFSNLEIWGASLDLCRSKG